MKNEIIDITTPICNFVGQYQKSGTVRFHMPGHKGKAHMGMESMDITEIAGADNLYSPDGIIAESEANATMLFGTGRTVYGTEGSSQCVKTMIHMAVNANRHKANSKERAVILAARNVHKSFIYGAALADCDVEWLYGAVDELESGMQQRKEIYSILECVINPKALEDKIVSMQADKRLPAAVYVTSPDYLGNVQDIEGLAKVCHKYGIMLMVDNAHGAYLHFVEDGMHPIDLGADMCCDSAHKTLPVLTGGAYLHISADSEYFDYLSHNAKQVMAIYGSTSPSYLIMESLDMCNRYLADGYRDRLSEFIEELNIIRGKLGDYLLSTDDKLKLTFHVPGISGEALADVLRQHGGECEYADKDYMVLMLSPDTDSFFLQMLVDVITEVIDNVKSKEEPGDVVERISGKNISTEQHRCDISIRQAIFADHEVVDINNAVGRVCASPVVACPPAIPIVMSGEVITGTDVEIFKVYNIDKVDVII